MTTATGQYRLFRQVGGRARFAHVFVEVLREGGEPAVRWAVDSHDRASAQPQFDADLMEAAIAGALDAFGELTQIGFDTKGWVVLIKRVIITLVDSEATAVRVAASAATVNAFGFEGAFEVTYTNGLRFERRSTN
jgi:hypothetical protein